MTSDENLLVNHLHPLHLSLPLAKHFPEYNVVPGCTGRLLLSNEEKIPTTTGDMSQDIDQSDVAPRVSRYAHRQVQRDSQDLDSQDGDMNHNMPSVPSPQKKGGQYACMMDSNPELNSTNLGGEKVLPLQKKVNLNAHITDKFKELYKIYEMVNSPVVFEVSVKFG